jgi:hypothetical protein
LKNENKKTNELDIMLHFICFYVIFVYHKENEVIILKNRFEQPTMVLTSLINYFEELQYFLQNAQTNP